MNQIHTIYRSSLKRVLDIVVSSLALILLSPLIILTSLGVWYKHGSPILYRQCRPGLDGKLFHIIKFRTMTDERDTDGVLLSDAKRLTKFGRFLRSTSLDELPELWNVLKGDMSLVGPRPLLTEYLDHYTPEQMHRHDVRPGITGWAQVKGRNTLSWEAKFNYDVWYVNNISLWLDIKILFLTVWTTIRRDGISANGHATMPKFMGNTS